MTRHPRSTVAAALAMIALTLASCGFSSEQAPEAFRDDASDRVDTAGPDEAGSDEAGSDMAGPDAVGGSDPTPSVDPDARIDDQWHDAAARGRAENRDLTPLAEDCLELAEEPLTVREVVGDPMAELRAGTAPSIDGPSYPLDEVVEFDSFEDYPDPSTPSDLDALLSAWRDAGFRGGVSAKDEEGSYLVMATVVEFASPADARAAVQAHIRDLCLRSVEAERLADGSGMTMLRESGAVRSVAAAGPYELSFFICHCYGANDDERLEIFERWRSNFEDWTEPAEDDVLPTA